MRATPLVAVVALSLGASEAHADPPESRLTLDQRAGTLRTPEGVWKPSLYQTAVELEARWRHFGLAARIFDYQLVSGLHRTLGASIGPRVPLLQRGGHELVAGVDIGGASYTWLLWWGEDGAPRGLAVTGDLRWTAPMTRRVSLGASLRYGGLVHEEVRWLSGALVLTFRLGKK